MSDAIDTVCAALIRANETEALAALAVVEADQQRLRDALLGLQCTRSLAGTAWYSSDGQPCWCGAGERGHSPECLAARAALGREGEALEASAKTADAPDGGPEHAHAVSAGWVAQGAPAAVGLADLDYVLRWLRQSSAPDNIILLQERGVRLTAAGSGREGEARPTDLGASASGRADAEATWRWKIGCPSGRHANVGRCDCTEADRG